MQTDRKVLKVHFTPGKPAPKISFQGQWLTDWGFFIGDCIKVAMSHNQITITKIDKPEQLPRKKVKATLPVGTISKVKETALSYQLEEEEVLEKALIYYFKRKGVM